MNAQHTPGPWAVEHGVIVAKSGRLSIAEIHDHSDTSNEHDANESGANAQLIAAAPDLLEACKKAYSLAESQYRDGLDRSGAIMSALYSIIAESEGRKLAAL